MYYIIGGIIGIVITTTGCFIHSIEAKDTSLLLWYVITIYGGIIGVCFGGIMKNNLKYD